MGKQDFVARRKFASDSSAHREGERGHVGTKDNFIGRAVEEIPHGSAGGGDHLIRAAAGSESAASVGVVAAQIIADSINDALRNLRAARPVKKHGGMAVHALRERRKLGTDPGDVKHGNGFSMSCRHEFMVSRRQHGFTIAVCKIVRETLLPLDNS